MAQVHDYRPGRDAEPELSIMYGRFPGKRSFGTRTFRVGKGVWHIFQMTGVSMSTMTRCGKAWTADAEMTSIKPSGKVCAKCARHSPETK